MEVDPGILRPQERVSLLLRARYGRAGYHRYRMSRFEEYALYRDNLRFLASEQVITFTDLDGRLLAMKPDVTLSIAKNAQPAPGACERYYYLENVYRPGRESRTFREIAQMGLECIGAVGPEETAEVVSLAGESLAAAEAPFVLVLSHMGYVTGLLDAAGTRQGVRARLLECVRDRNAHELRALAAREGVPPDCAEALCGLLALSGPWREVLDAAEAAARNEASAQAAAELRAICVQAAARVPEGALRVDFSLVNDLLYYNGIVFQGYLDGRPEAVLRGGRYDPLVAQFLPGAGAVGFALYLDGLDYPAPAAERAAGRAVLNVALPKGRLGAEVLALFARAGLPCPEALGETRRLVAESPDGALRFFLVKPSDVPVYVEHGTADVGIAGRDVTVESGADVYELLDTGLGRCRMCVAGREDFADDPGRSLRVATKFERIAKSYYAGLGRDIDIIRLNGSIELAPLLGLSDVIVDIVETGTTLRENGLRVLRAFMPISARLIANRAACQFKSAEIGELAEKLKEAAQRDSDT